MAAGAATAAIDSAEIVLTRPSMLISETHGFIFVHVQKTAGTSLTRLLEPVALRPDSGRLNRIASDLNLRPWRHTLFRKHAPLRRARQRLPEAFYRDCLKFAFVRNPWDRLVSWYGYIKATPEHHRHRKVGRMSDFDTFVNAITGSERRSQWWMLDDGSGRPGVDFVGRYENLGEDVAELCRRLQLPAQPLPHHNRSERVDYRSYYSDASAERVLNCWRREIDWLGYRFDG